MSKFVIMLLIFVAQKNICNLCCREDLLGGESLTLEEEVYWIVLLAEAGSKSWIKGIVPLVFITFYPKPDSRKIASALLYFLSKTRLKDNCICTLILFIQNHTQGKLHLHFYTFYPKQDSSKIASALLYFLSKISWWSRYTTKVKEEYGLQKIPHPGSLKELQIIIHDLLQCYIMEGVKKIDFF